MVAVGNGWHKELEKQDLYCRLVSEACWVTGSTKAPGTLGSP